MALERECASQQGRSGVETRHQRARRDMRGWVSTRKEFTYAVVGGALGVVVQVLAGHTADVKTAAIALGVALATAFLVPLLVYAGAWLTAVGRIHRDELIAIRHAVGELAKRFEGKKQESEVVGRLKELKSFASIVNARVPTFENQGVPPDVETTVAAWEQRVSDALSSQPELQQQFRAATAPDNPLLAAFKAHPFAVRLQEKIRILDSIIKHLEVSS